MITRGDPAALSQCLEFCQALASKGQKFTLNLAHTGTSFTFSLDTREVTTLETREEKNLLKKKKKKKVSPSNRRRNQRRKEEFLQRKSEISTEVTAQDKKTPEQLKTLKCDQCEKSFNTRNGLKIHKGKSHKCSELPTPEKLLSPEKFSDKELSPEKEAKREEEAEEKDFPTDEDMIRDLKCSCEMVRKGNMGPADTCIVCLNCYDCCECTIFRNNQGWSL